MSGFGSSGFGGFGQTNNTQSGFGGFGNTNNTNTTFGSGNAASTSNTFGSTNAGGNLFGSGGSFGATAGNTTGFGSKPAFGSANTGGGLFGGSNTTTNTTSGFGGFGNTANTSTTFGSGTSGGLFGSKPATTGFGASTTTNTGSTSLFGGGGGFGATNNPGIGTNIGEAPGTATVQFQAHTEKEATGATNSFQNILFQEPYRKWSSDELRLVDYAQGRRHGNASGTGAFGVSSGFGSGTGFGSTTQSTGFGNTTGGGLFGGAGTSSTTPATGSFGQTGTGAFGSAAAPSGGLFGQKPATGVTGGGLFGAGATQPAQSGGLFGNTGTTGGFGNTGSTLGGGFGTNTNTGSSLFGNNAAAQNKPTGFSFGNTGAATTGFGQTNTTNAFGTNTTANQNQGGGLFGNATAQQAGTGGGLFGNAQQPQQQTTGFGNTGFGAQNQQSGSSLFGTTAPKPTGGLFGTAGANTTTGASGSMFGNTSTGTSAFGTGSSLGAGTGLFGNKPAVGSTGGIFGSSTTQNAGTGTGLFGGQAQHAQQTGQSSLFSLGQNQPKPSLFGSQPQQTGGGLFGNQTTQAQGSIFGGGVNQQQQQQQQQNSLLGSSLLGGGQGMNAGAQSLTASISDVSAYGAPSLFASQGAGEVANPGPLATPLSSKGKSRRGSILPMYKLNPASARYSTPQRRGFGFSYSTYGTPGTPSSAASTPGGLGKSLLGSSLGRGLSKSMSTNSLRRSFNTEDSILTPGAFSASSGARYYGNPGSAKKLIINREMRNDLFSTPTKEKPLLEAGKPTARKLSKRVSFDTSTIDSPHEEEQGSTSGPKDAGPPSATSTPRVASRASNGTSAVSTPQPEPAKGNELAIVREEEATAVPRIAINVPTEPGEYWMRPSKAEILEMNRIQRQKVPNFVVGRQNVGEIRFKAPVDLSGIDLDDLFGNIVLLQVRSATVYPVAAKKPPMGKGLNVPAQIALEQSWPRKHTTTDEKKLNKHIERLQKIEGTTFESYDKATGTWTFLVPHFTTYGLDDDEDSDVDEGATEPGAGPHVSHGQSRDVNELELSPAASDADDTFSFRNNRPVVPGAFDAARPQNAAHQPALDDSFLGRSSAGSAPHQLMLSVEDEQPYSGDEYAMSDDEDTTGSLSGQHQAAELDTNSPEYEDKMQVNETPGGVLRARMRALKDSAGPPMVHVADGDDWMDMLQKTVSPQKRDRALLKTLSESMVQDVPESPVPMRERRVARVASDSRGFATSIDLMNSLFEKPKAVAPPQEKKIVDQSRGFPQWPYERQAKIVESQEGTSNKLPPRWGPDGTLILPLTSKILDLQNGLADNMGDILVIQKTRSQGEGAGVSMAKFSNELSARYLHNQVRLSKFHVEDGVPAVTLQLSRFSAMFTERSLSDHSSTHEKMVWDVASILFDDVAADVSEGRPEHLARRDHLSRFWQNLVAAQTTKNIALSQSLEEKALNSLAGHRVQEAVKHLIDGKNFQLATLVALIGASETAKRDMREQLKQWSDGNFLSEFSAPIRAIYEMLSGNVCVCDGKKGVPVEDRIDSFVISTLFNLDWKQAFGLRLWYAISAKEGISAAVKKFEEDVNQEREKWPQTWFAEQSITPLWNDPSPGKREDLIWGLLRLYADDQTDVESVLRPENSQLSPLDFRLTWQLGQALISSGKTTYGPNAADKADAITLSFASQLVNEGSWLEAVFVLLHLTDPAVRVKAIRDHLCQHADQVRGQGSDSWNTLVQTFRIPEAWIWDARALFMRSVVKDAREEVVCLLHAGSFGEAHRRLVEEVAPLAIVERDYQGLSDILSRFEGREATVSEWPVGGEVYLDFLTLVKARANPRNNAVSAALLQKIVGSLAALQGGSRSPSALVTAAITEMGDVVARSISGLADEVGRSSLLPKILTISLTEDAHLTHSVELSLAYYRDIMAR